MVIQNLEEGEFFVLITHKRAVFKVVLHKSHDICYTTRNLGAWTKCSCTVKLPCFIFEVQISSITNTIHYWTLSIIEWGAPSRAMYFSEKSVKEKHFSSGRKSLESVTCVWILLIAFRLWSDLYQCIESKNEWHGRARAVFGDTLSWYSGSSASPLSVNVKSIKQNISLHRHGFLGTHAPSSSRSITLMKEKKLWSKTHNSK